MDAALFTLSGHPVTTIEALAAATLLALLAVAVALVWRGRGKREDGELQRRVAELVRLQSEMTGRMQTMAEVFGSRQSELVRGLSERMDGLSHRIGQNLTASTRDTQEGLARLQERLAVIDTAQRNITDLSSQMVSLQHILANKQSRGAFGQGRMEAILQDGLPPSGFRFQATLSNGNRPDALVLFPNGAPALVVDAKFPLEAWNAIQRATEAEPDPEALRTAEIQFRRDLGKHVKDIAERYRVPGETQDTAFLFVPSESIFASIHERFDDIVQLAHRARIVIVSPSLLLLSIQVIQAVLRDVRMREQAHVIQDEVARLMDDVHRVNERVLKLQTHFGQATKDVDDILVSTRKLTGRGAKIEALQFGDEAPAVAAEARDLLAGE